MVMHKANLFSATSCASSACWLGGGNVTFYPDCSYRINIKLCFLKVDIIQFVFKD